MNDFQVNKGPFYELPITVQKLRTLTLEEAMTYSDQHENVRRLITTYPVIDVRMKKYIDRKACVYILIEYPEEPTSQLEKKSRSLSMDKNVALNNRT